MPRAARSTLDFYGQIRRLQTNGMIRLYLRSHFTRAAVTPTLLAIDSEAPRSRSAATASLLP